MTPTFAFTERMEQHPQEIHPFAEWLEARNPRHVLEIGVRHGGTSALWHEIASGLVIGVDWCGRDGLGEQTRVLADSMMLKYHRYRAIIGDSHDDITKQLIETVLGGELIDFLFLDGDHSYKGVKKDYEMYAPLVAKGGCIAFHDITDTAFMRQVGHGVPQFWKELTGEKLDFCIQAPWGGIGVVLV
jgi:cephalosporin hydroxylase